MLKDPCLRKQRDFQYKRIISDYQDTSTSPVTNGQPPHKQAAFSTCWNCCYHTNRPHRFPCASSFIWAAQIPWPSLTSKLQGTALLRGIPSVEHPPREAGNFGRKRGREGEEAGGPDSLLYTVLPIFFKVCICIHLNPYVLEWTEIKLNLILPQSISTHVNWDEYMCIQTRF
jgi:hypothetical protein